MQNLKDKYPEAYQALINHNYNSLCRMMGIFSRQTDMDRALGTNSAVHNWMTLKNMPTEKFEVRAQRYFWKLEEAQEAADKEPVETSAPKPIAKKAPAEPKAEEELFLVTVPAHQVHRVEAVLKMLKCDLVTI